MTHRGVVEAPAADIRSYIGLVSWALIAGTVTVTLPRLTPVGSGDFATFVSVAERLRSGDRLYVDVWDNKDPYFYYALTVMGSLGTWGYYLLEVVWVGIAVFALAQLGRSTGMSSRWSLVVAGGLAPWCLIGATYVGSMTIMPGIALALAALALAARGRWGWVGVVLGLLLFLKLILVPVAVVGAAVFCSSPRSRACAQVLLGGVASTVFGAIVLALRGELAAYVSMLGRNSEYASRMVDGGGVAGFVDHLSRAFPSGEYPGAGFAACAIVVGLAVAAWRARSRSRRLVGCAAVVALTCIVVLGFTAVWSHHAQLLAVPASLTLLALAQGGPPRDVTRYVGVLVAGVLAAYLLGGATPLSELTIRPARAVAPLEAIRGDSPEAASVAGDDVASYARLGRNDFDAHARGLGALTLACADIQQYQFDPPSTYERTLRCLPESDVVFVSLNFADEPVPDYIAFTDEAEEILANQFECTVTSYGRKCLKRDR